MGLQFMACGYICKLYAYTTKYAQYFKRLGVPFLMTFTCAALQISPQCWLWPFSKKGWTPMENNTSIFTKTT